jgi:hypothetical protein
MSTWWTNVLTISILAFIEMWLGISLFWHVSQWRAPRAGILIEDYGLPIGSKALEIAALTGQRDVHLSFLGRFTFLVFGAADCSPCKDLLRVASTHPATRTMRLVFVADTDQLPIHPDATRSWEIYRFHDEDLARKVWAAPVSPYFHVIDPEGRIAAKGIADKHPHLDRLLVTSRPISMGPRSEVVSPRMT